MAPRFGYVNRYLESLPYIPAVEENSVQKESFMRKIWRLLDIEIPYIWIWGVNYG